MIVVLPTLFIVVNNIEQCGQHNIVQSFSQQDCNRLMIFCRVEIESESELEVKIF